MIKIIIGETVLILIGIFCCFGSFLLGSLLGGAIGIGLEEDTIEQLKKRVIELEIKLAKYKS